MTGKNRDRDGRRTTFGNVGSKAACWCASALLVLVGLGACTSHDAHPRATSDPPSVSTSSTTTATAPPTSSTDRESADRTAIEAAYAQLWQTLDTIQTSGVPQSEWFAEFRKVAAEPLAQQAAQNEINELKAGLRGYGRTTLRPLNFTKPIGSSAVAAFTDCLDTSRTGKEVAATGQKRTVGVPRALTVNEATRGADGTWQISMVTFPPKGTC
jgi:hypothetical protein